MSFPLGDENDGDDLLAAGVARHFARVLYDSPGNAYGRLFHPPFPVRFPAAAQATEAERSAGAPPLHAALDPALLACEPLALIDIESLGFVGRPVFLVGALSIRPAARRGQPEREGLGTSEARLVQYLARDYSEEEAMLRACLGECASSRIWVTFNGRTFDVPALAVRSSFHRLAFPTPGRHLDLLPLARRLWGARLPDCRLQTLEQRICGRPRGGDIDSARIPGAYHDFVRTGEPWEMLEILRHNAADLVTLCRVLERACSAAREGGERGPDDR